MLDIEEVLSGVGGDQLHVIVADVYQVLRYGGQGHS